MSAETDMAMTVGDPICPHCDRPVTGVNVLATIQQGRKYVASLHFHPSCARAFAAGLEEQAAFVDAVERKAGATRPADFAPYRDRPWPNAATSTPGGDRSWPKEWRIALTLAVLIVAAYGLVSMTADIIWLLFQRPY